MFSFLNTLRNTNFQVGKSQRKMLDSFALFYMVVRAAIRDNYTGSHAGVTDFALPRNSQEKF